MREIRVAHVITGLLTGGAERMLSKVSSAMEAMGVRSTILAGLGGRMEHELRDAGHPPHVIWRKPTGLPDGPAFGSFLRRCARGEFDGFMGWMYHGNLLATMLGGMSRRPVVWGVRQTLSLDDAQKPLIPLVVRAGAALSGHAKAVIYNSHAAAAMHHGIGYRAQGTRVIPNGFDPEVFFRDAPAAANLRARNGLKPEDRIVGLVARNHPMKDLPTFVEMAVRVWQLRKDVRFLLVGRGLAEEGSDVRRLVARTACAEHFLFMDERADLRPVYSAMDVFCLTSRSNEAFPNVLGEAMFCGAPCVTTDVGDAAGIVGDPGRVTRAGDAEALANAVLGILALDVEPYHALSRRIRERAVQLYSLHGVAQQYAEVCATEFVKREDVNSMQVKS